MILIPKTIPKLDIVSPISGSNALSSIAVGVLVLTSIVLLLSLTVFIHHLVTDRQRRLNRERFEAAVLLLAPHLVAGNASSLEAAVSGCRSSQGDRAVALVLRRARYDIKGPIVDLISRVLIDMGEVRKLMKEAGSRRDWRRAVAIRGLGECGGEEARGALVRAATDPSSEVRRAAREGLLTDGSTEAIKVAIESFLTDLPRRAGWRRSFYARLAASASEELLELATSGRLGTQEEKLALEALGDANCVKALPIAIMRAADASAEMRATAVRVIGKLGHTSELPLVTQALDDPEWFVRAAAARSLEWIVATTTMVRGTPDENRICALLGRKLTDTSWWVRANAARALSRAGTSGIRVLVEASEGTDNFARDAAIAALAMAPLSGDTRTHVKKMIDQSLEKQGIPPGPHLLIAKPRALSA